MSIDKCVNCGHKSMMPFYQGYKEKRVKCFVKSLKCPKCKRCMDLDIGADIFTQEELEVRKVGLPSLCCGVPYQQAYEYGHKSICKSCGKSFYNKEIK